MKRVEYMAIPDIPLIKKGDDIAQIIIDSYLNRVISIFDNDIIIIAQKIVSIAEGSIINLNNVKPSSRAIELAESTGRTPEECQVYLDESSDILEVSGRYIITRHKIGYVCTSAGVDKSNVSEKKDRLVTLLPKDPDKSAQEIKSKIFDTLGVNVAVIISDTMGRPYRRGSIGEAIGIAGIKALEEKESQDLFGNSSKPQIALVDQLASAATILLGESNEKTPIVIVRGVNYTSSENSKIQDLLK